jgi:DNA-binding beta-propeller fold protein YncE
MIDSDGFYNAPGGQCPAEVGIGARIVGSSVPFTWSTVVLGETDQLYSIRGYWNRQGEGLGELREAHEIDVERAGNLLIVDSKSSRILRYTPEGKYLDELGMGPGTQRGEFGGPRDVKVDPISGEIYVVDGENCRIQVFDPEGNVLRCWGQRGSGPGDLEGPHSIDLAPDGLLYVADVGNSRVSVFDRNGRHVRSWGSCGTQCGEFLAPHGIASDPNGDIFVVEYKGRCQKFTPEGDFLFEFGNQCVQQDATHGDCKYHAISSDDMGNVYLMARDTLKNFYNTIDKYNNQGNLVTRICYPIDGDHWMGAKGAVIIPSGRIYVADNQRDHAGVTIFEPI